MIIDKADALLNDQEINLLADLFLARYGFDKTSLRYRLIRNAVILCSHGAWRIDEVYALVAAAADIPTEQAATEIRRTFSTIKPPSETFNMYYAPPPIEGELRGANITMPSFGRGDDIVEFLGTVFMYLILTNYNNYEYIDYKPQKTAT